MWKYGAPRQPSSGALAYPLRLNPYMWRLAAVKRRFSDTLGRHMDELSKRRAADRLADEQKIVRDFIVALQREVLDFGERFIPEGLREDPREFIGRALEAVGRSIRNSTPVCLNELRSGKATCNCGSKGAMR